MQGVLGLRSHELLAKKANARIQDRFDGRSTTMCTNLVKAQSGGAPLSHCSSPKLDKMLNDDDDDKYESCVDYRVMHDDDDVRGSVR